MFAETSADDRVLSWWGRRHDHVIGATADRLDALRGTGEPLGAFHLRYANPR
jgi:hypothetical protein